MAIMKNPLVAVALATLVTAQSSDVATIFFPGVDQQQLLASVVESDASRTTLAVGCPTDAADDECGFIVPVTVTVGPSTFRAQETFEGVTALLECAVDGTTAAECAQTYVGPAYIIETDIDVLTASDATTDTRIITTSTSTVLTGTDVVFIPVTLTDELFNAAATGASGSAVTASNTGSRTTGGSSTGTESGSEASTTGSSTGSGSRTSASSSPTGSASSTAGSSGNGAGKAEVRGLALSALGAGLVGLVTFLL